MESAVIMPGVIAVLGGTGPEGFGLALRWVRAGETVIIGSRDADGLAKPQQKSALRSAARQKFPAKKTAPPALLPICWC